MFFMDVNECMYANVWLHGLSAGLPYAIVGIESKFQNMIIMKASWKWPNAKQSFLEMETNLDRRLNEMMKHEE